MYLLFNKFLSVITIAFSLHLYCYAFGGRYFPTRCVSFTDKRTNIIKDDGDHTVLLIPPHLTNARDQELKFFMEFAGNTRAATKYMKHCKIPINLSISLLKGDTYSGQHGVSTKKHPFQNQLKFNNKIYFTVDGYLHHKSHFLNPMDYCVQSISDTELDIQTCKLNCAADLSKNKVLNSNPEYESSRICIPKCCGIDETLSLSDQTCRKLNDTEANYFLPYLHLSQPVRFLQGSTDPGDVDKYKVLVTPTLSSGRATWNGTVGLIGSIRSLWKNIHFFQSSVPACSNFIIKETKFDDVKEYVKNNRIKNNFRIQMDSGMVKLAFLTKSRKWIEYNKEFCVDGVDNWGKGVYDDAVIQVVVVCVGGDLTSSPKNIQGEVVVETSDDKKPSPAQYVLLAVKLIVSIWLLFGFWMFMMIRKKLNLNGKIIASHLACVSILRLWTVVAIFADGEYSRVRNNAFEVVSSEFAGDERIGWFCLGVGVLCHYLYITCFIWLIVMGMFSWEMKKWANEYWIYGIFTWGIPIGIVQAFCLVDWLNNDPFGDAFDPDYAVESCFVASWSAGYYVYLPAGLNLMLGFILILVKVLPNARDFFVEGSKDKFTPIKLFAIVWCIQLVAWILGVTEWIRVKNGNKQNLARTLILIVGSVLEAFALIHVYCMNEVVLGLVGERVSSFHAIAKFLKNKKLIWKGSGVLGHICEQDAAETVVIEGEELVERRG